jgi:2-succinyl-5-enolpyruvyl-6-hydroxy-3-cyclohexene-1-carboxylate synthase
MGAAQVSKRPNTLITGDIAFLYDNNAFWNRCPAANLRVVVVDNGGGNIFRYIEGPDRDPALLPWFEAPHGRDPAAMARSFDLPCLEATDMPSLNAALDELYAPSDRAVILVVRTDPTVSPAILRNYFKELRT